MKLKVVEKKNLGKLKDFRFKKFENERQKIQRIRSGRKLSKWRLKAWEEVKGRCAACGTLTEFNASHRGFHLDHIIPLFEGGKDVSENRQVLCIHCHEKKTAKEKASPYFTARQRR